MLVHMRNSERKPLNRCAQQWDWSILQGLTPAAPGKAQWFGQGIHLALAHYYQPGLKRNTDMIDVWREFADEEGEILRVHSTKGLDEEEFVEAKALGEAMLLGYMEEYGGDENWDVIATEQHFQVRIPYEESNPFRAYLEAMGLDPDYFELDGTFDGVYRDLVSRRLKLMEHKTAGSIRIGHLNLDNQAGTYWAVAHTVLKHLGILSGRQNISEITYNFLRKAMPDQRERDPETGQRLNKDGSISKRQPPKLYVRHPVRRRPQERTQQIARLKGEVGLSLAYRSGEVTIGKNPGDHCAWCPFKEMCELHEQNAAWEDFRDMMFTKRDPYEDHRKSASE